MTRETAPNGSGVAVSGGSQGTFDVSETLDRFGGDVEFLQDVAEQFVSEAATLLGVMRSALEASSGDELARAAHGLKGAASNFGAAALVECAQCVEDLGQGSDVEAARPHVEKLTAHVEQLNAALSDYCTSHLGT